MITVKNISTAINPSQKGLFEGPSLEQPASFISAESSSAYNKARKLPKSLSGQNLRQNTGAATDYDPAWGEKKTPAIRAALRSLILLVALAVGLSGCALFSPGSSAVGKAAAKTAHKYIGVPYKLGGKSPKEGFDCSSLVQYVYARHGVKLPRSSSEQAKYGRKVRKGQLQPGDLVFFSTGKRGRVSHVGIYIGNDKFIHAPGRGKKVTKASLSAEYFKKTFHSARRVG